MSDHLDFPHFFRIPLSKEICSQIFDGTLALRSFFFLHVPPLPRSREKLVSLPLDVLLPFRTP